MKHPLLAAAAALLLAAPGVRAATFDLDIAGSGTHWYVDGVPGCDFSNPANACVDGFANEAWIGGLEVTTLSTADGVYGYGAGLQGLAYSSNFDSFSYADGDQQTLVYPQFSGGNPFLVGLVPGASVTVADGQVVAVNGTFAWSDISNITFAGLAVSDYNSGQSCDPDTDVWNSSGALTNASTPQSTPVPEPTTWLLMVCSLAVLTRTGCFGGTHCRRSRSR